MKKKTPVTERPLSYAEQIDPRFREKMRRLRARLPDGADRLALWTAGRAIEAELEAEYGPNPYSVRARLEHPDLAAALSLASAAGRMGIDR